LLLISNIDKKNHFTSDLAKAFEGFDKRNPEMIVHTIEEMYKQRIYGIIAGHEDLNDHKSIREDELFKTILGKDIELASPSTLCRLENKSVREICLRMSETIVEDFIKDLKKRPEELVLDFDATDDPVHGNQEGKFPHGYYDNYCFLPLYVFCNRKLLVSYLRPANIDAAFHGWAILSLLVKRFRQQWPDVRIIFRGDGGFCRHKMLSWCERNNVEYIIGIPSNKRLERITHIEARVGGKYNRTKKKVKLYTEVYYQAQTWNRKRKIIVKAEHNEKGKNTRYIITNLKGKTKELYENIYCARGDMGNRIKEQ